MEEAFVCFGFLALLCLLAALPLSVVALMLAVRTTTAQVIRNSITHCGAAGVQNK